MAAEDDFLEFNIQTRTLSSWFSKLTLATNFHKKRSKLHRKCWQAKHGFIILISYSSVLNTYMGYSSCNCHFKAFSECGKCLKHGCAHDGIYQCKKSIGNVDGCLANSKT